jgi:hypothetical protein
MSSPSSFGINLSSGNYTNSRQNRFAAVGNPYGVPANANWLWCTEFAFGRALEKGLISSTSGIGYKIAGTPGAHANVWNDRAGSFSSRPQANKHLQNTNYVLARSDKI